MAGIEIRDLSGTSPATASTAAGAVIANGLDQFDWFTVDAVLTGATGGALDVYLQRDVNGTWVDWLHFTQLAAGAAAVRTTIDSQSIENGPIAVGSGTSPILTAGKFSCMHPGEKVRVLYVAGASTSAGATQTIIITGWKRRI